MEKLRKFTLSSATKENLSQAVGVPFNELQNMDTEQQDQQAARQVGRPITWNPERRVGVYPVGRTIDEVDAQLTRITDGGLCR